MFVTCASFHDAVHRLPLIVGVDFYY